MKKTAVFVIALFTVIIFITSCEEEIVTPVCNSSTPTYNSDIKAIIDNNCTSCHGSGSSRNFRTYQGLKPYLDNGKFELLVLEKQTMPKGGRKLSQEELNKIQCWVNDGYPEN